jgi:hypothetical protein
MTAASSNVNAPASARSIPPAPYKGLVPYTDNDYALFFGRDAERAIIVANVRSSRFTLLYGPSGVGKSSVVGAGVVHFLRERAKQNLQKRGTPEFAVVYFNQWRDNPIADLLRAVRETVEKLLGKTFPDDEAFQNKSLDEQLKVWAERVNGALLILLDQFEDYFLYHPNEDGPGTFAYEFPLVVTDSQAHVNFVISIREDALAKLDRFEGRIPTLFDNYIRVDHLDRTAARDAIVKPIEQYNKGIGDQGFRVSIEPALVEAVLDETKTGRVSLGDTGVGIVKDELELGEEETASSRIETPFLQLVMTRLWDEELRAGSHVLRLETLRRLGGAERIVRTHLDKTMNMLPARERAMAAAMFHYLVTPSGTKIAHTARDLAEYTGNQEKDLVPVLEKMSASGIRILRPVAPPPDQMDAPTRYEIFHDVLAPAMLDWRRRYYQQRRNRIIYFALGAVVLGVVVLVGLLWLNLRQSQQALEQKAQEAQALSQAILTTQPTGAANAPPTFVALRETAAAVGTSAAAVTCQGAPVITFTSSQARVAPGDSVYLQWSDARRVTDVTIEPGLGKVSVTGTQVVQPTETTRYTLTAEGCGGKTTQTVTIQVVVPTATTEPTNPPPTATAPVPTDIPPTNTRIPPTRVPSTPTPNVSPTPNLPPGVYVTNVRVDPPEPRSGDEITFYTTLLNTREEQQYNYCVEIFRGQDVSKSVGISTCRPVSVAPGTNEFSSTGWNVREGSCTQYLARAISEDLAKARTPFLQPDGSIYYLNFTVCP